MAEEIKIDGIAPVKRDHAFDNERYTSGGIRLYYESNTTVVKGIKEGILLEAGFDTVTPNNKVEKLQTIATKYRQEQNEGKFTPNYMRQYYDISCLLTNVEVQDFLRTEEYQNHKKARFPKKDLDIPIAENEAFLLTSNELRESFKMRYAGTSKLYYQGQPRFEEILETISKYIDKL